VLEGKKQKEERNIKEKVEIQKLEINVELVKSKDAEKEEKNEDKFRNYI
tara:strand:+ start:95 stop:241 length:147 start_codon:yes stop_codon:yes gene_type:complete